MLFRSKLQETATIADTATCELDFAAGIAAVNEFIGAVNVYVTEQEPWKVAKDEAQLPRVETILYVICEALRGIAVLYNAVMPKAMQELWNQLGAEAALGALDAQRVQDAGTWGQLPAGSVITKGAVLFPRLEDAE